MVAARASGQAGRCGVKFVRSAAAHVAAGVLLAWLLVGCTASAREKALHASLVATDAARDGFVAYDLTKQKQILDDAPDAPGWRDAIVTYRQKRDRIESLFAGAYRAIAAAAVIDDDPKSLDNVVTAAQLLYSALHEFTGGKI